MKNLLAIFLLASYPFFISCNNDADSSKIDLAENNKEYTFILDDTTNRCQHAGGLANFLLDSAKADSMIKMYNGIYGIDLNGEEVSALKRNFWLDECTLKSIAEFLEKNDTVYDGIRISFGASGLPDLSRYPKPPYQNETTIFIYPTVPSKGGTGHRDSGIVISSECSPATNYIQPYNIARPQMEKYDTLYHQTMSDAGTAKTKLLSQGIWIDTCVIFYIADLIKKSSGILNGINIKTAAYLGNEPSYVKGQDAPKQSTIIMVPTSKDSLNPDKTIDNWAVIAQIRKRKSKMFLGALNHGELCPTRCN